MTSARTVIIAGFVLLLVQATAFAGTPDSKGESGRLSLEQVVQAAMAHYPALKAAGLMTEAAGMDAEMASANRKPRLDLSATYSALDNPMYAFGNRLNQERISQADFDPAALNDPDVSYNSNYALSMYWPLHTGGSVEGYVKAARAGQEAERARETYARRRLAAEAGQAFLGAVFLKRKAEVLSSFEETASSHRDLAESFVRNGMTVEADLMAAEVHLSAARRERIDTAGKLDTAVSTLSHLTGNYLPIGAELLPEDFAACPVGEESLEDLLREAALNRAELRELEHRVRALDGMKRGVRGGGRTQVGLMGRTELNLEDPFGGGGESFSVMLMFNQSLYDGGARKAEIKKFDLQRHALLEMLAEKVSLVELEVRSAWNDLQAANEGVNVTREAATLAEENLRITDNRYRNGLVNYIELRDAEDLLKGARLQHLGARYQVQISRIALELAVGRADQIGCDGEEGK
jgi:outer membrane protein TolC